MSATYKFKVYATLLAIIGIGFTSAVDSDSNDKNRSNFKYGYVMSYKGGSSQAHLESRDGNLALGRYYVKLPNGNGQKVTYFADELGFHPGVSYSSRNGKGSSKTQIAVGAKALAALEPFDPEHDNAISASTASPSFGSSVSPGLNDVTPNPTYPKLNYTPVPGGFYLTYAPTESPAHTTANPSSVSIVSSPAFTGSSVFGAKFSSGVSQAKVNTQSFHSSSVRNDFKQVRIQSSTPSIKSFGALRGNHAASVKYTPNTVQSSSFATGPEITTYTQQKSIEMTKFADADAQLLSRVQQHAENIIQKDLKKEQNRNYNTFVTGGQKFNTATMQPIVVTKDSSVSSTLAPPVSVSQFSKASGTSNIAITTFSPSVGKYDKAQKDVSVNSIKSTEKSFTDQYPNSASVRVSLTPTTTPSTYEVTDENLEQYNASGLTSSKNFLGTIKDVKSYKTGDDSTSGHTNKITQTFYPQNKLTMERHFVTTIDVQRGISLDVEHNDDGTIQLAANFPFNKVRLHGGNQSKKPTAESFSSGPVSTPLPSLFTATSGPSSSTTKKPYVVNSVALKEGLFNPTQNQNLGVLQGFNDISPNPKKFSSDLQDRISSNRIFDNQLLTPTSVPQVSISSNSQFHGSNTPSGVSFGHLTDQSPQVFGVQNAQYALSPSVVPQTNQQVYLPSGPTVATPTNQQFYAPTTTLIPQTNQQFYSPIPSEIPQTNQQVYVPSSPTAITPTNQPFYSSTPNVIPQTDQQVYNPQQLYLQNQAYAQNAQQISLNSQVYSTPPPQALVSQTPQSLIQSNPLLNQIDIDYGQRQEAERQNADLKEVQQSIQQLRQQIISSIDAQHEEEENRQKFVDQERKEYFENLKKIEELKERNQHHFGFITTTAAPVTSLDVSNSIDVVSNTQGQYVSTPQTSYQSEIKDFTNQVPVLYASVEQTTNNAGYYPKTFLGFNGFESQYIYAPYNIQYLDNSIQQPIPTFAIHRTQAPTYSQIEQVNPEPRYLASIGVQEDKIQALSQSQAQLQRIPVLHGYQIPAGGLFQAKAQEGGKSPVFNPFEYTRLYQVRQQYPLFQAQQTPQVPRVPPIPAQNQVAIPQVQIPVSRPSAPQIPVPQVQVPQVSVPRIQVPVSQRPSSVHVQSRVPQQVRTQQYYTDAVGTHSDKQFYTTFSQRATNKLRVTPLKPSPPAEDAHRETLQNILSQSPFTRTYIYPGLPYTGPVQYQGHLQLSQFPVGTAGILNSDQIASQSLRRGKSLKNLRIEYGFKPPLRPSVEFSEEVKPSIYGPSVPPQ